MRAPTLNVPSVNLSSLHVPDLHVPNVKAPAVLGKAAEKITKRKAKKQKRRLWTMLFTRFPMMAAVGWLIGWLTDPVSGAERRQRLMGRATSMMGKGDTAMDQVRGQAATSFDRMSGAMPAAEAPATPAVQPPGPQAPFGQ
jgi:hypothetical protein